MLFAVDVLAWVEFEAFSVNSARTAPAFVGDTDVDALLDVPGMANLLGDDGIPPGIADCIAPLLTPPEAAALALDIATFGNC